MQCTDAVSVSSLQLAELDAQKHAGLVKSVADDIREYQAPDMPALVEFVRDTSARLGVIMTDEAAVLSQFPTWPQVRLKLLFWARHGNRPKPVYHGLDAVSHTPAVMLQSCAVCIRLTGPDVWM